MTWLKTLLHLHHKALGHPLKQPPPVDDGGDLNLLGRSSYRCSPAFVPLLLDRCAACGPHLFTTGRERGTGRSTWFDRPVYSHPHHMEYIVAAEDCTTQLQFP